MTAPAVNPIGPVPVYTLADAQARGVELLEKLLHHRRPGESVKAAIGRAARLAGLEYERTREIWYARAKLMAHELMQLEARVDRRDAQLARLLDRLAGLADAPALPPTLTVEEAAQLAQLAPGVEPWARKLGLVARALIVACLFSAVLPVLLDHYADARPVKRGGPVAAKLEPKLGGKVPPKLPKITLRKVGLRGGCG